MGISLENMSMMVRFDMTVRISVTMIIPMTVAMAHWMFVYVSRLCPHTLMMNRTARYADAVGDFIISTAT